MYDYSANIIYFLFISVCPFHKLKERNDNTDFNIFNDGDNIGFKKLSIIGLDYISTILKNTIIKKIYKISKLKKKLETLELLDTPQSIIHNTRERRTVNIHTSSKRQ